jgi:Yip1-like protein
MLDARVYEDVEANPSATLQAALVVLLSSLAAGVGTGSAGFEARAIIIGTIGGFVAWVSWAALTYLLGTHLLPEPQTRADLGELLRTLAFAAAPGILRVVGVVPALGWPAFAVTSVWMLAAMVVAVRQALDYRSTSRAIAVCALGWLLSLAVASIIGIFFPATVS